MSGYPGIPDQVRREPATINLLGLIANHVQHMTGADWNRSSSAASLAHDEDLADVGEWADLAVELLRIIGPPGSLRRNE